MKIREKQAISLIVLVITILVLSILAATVIISLSNTNIINETSKTVLKSNLSTMQDMATVYLADNYGTIDMEKEYLITEFGITDDEFKDYRDYAFVKAGKVYIKLNAPEDIQEVAEELNMLIDGTSSSTGEVAVEKTVKALRIYGNTENAESVGEKSKNLFDWKFPNKRDYLVTNEFREDNLFLSITDKDTTVDISGIYLVFTDTQAYPFNLAQYLIYDGTITKTVVSNASTYKYLAVYPATQEAVNKLNARFNIQVEEGSESTSYEPYGYKIPVRVTGSDMADKTYNIYLTEPLRKIGNVADYVDCTTGEVVRYIGVTSAGELEVLSTPIKESVTLEEMDFEGVNHIVVDTTVTPSNIEIKY